MKPTETEQLLIDYLKLYKISRAERAIIFLLMETESQQIKLCQFLKDNEKATSKEIMAEAQKIAI